VGVFFVPARKTGFRCNQTEVFLIQVITPCLLEGNCYKCVTKTRGSLLWAAGLGQSPLDSTGHGQSSLSGVAGLPMSSCIEVPIGCCYVTWFCIADFIPPFRAGLVHLFVYHSPLVSARADAIISCSYMQGVPPDSACHHWDIIYYVFSVNIPLFCSSQIHLVKSANYFPYTLFRVGWVVT
jgi:hypothetical protein